MRFSPQRRALFRHLNFQKWSGAGVFCTFWLRNVLRTTTACNFSSLIWPDGFFTRRFSLASLLFDPLEPQILGKTQCFATFLPFRTPGSSFFWLFLFSDLLSSTLLFSLTLPSRLCFSSVHLSEVWFLNFLRLLYCWNLTASKAWITPALPDQMSEIARHLIDGRPRPTAEEEIIGPSSSNFCCRFIAHLGNGRQYWTFIQ